MNKILGLLLLFFVSSFSLLAQDLDKGKQLFKDKACASCHNKDMKTKLVGPGLGGVEERWADYPKEDLYNWIRDSKSMVDAGHKKAVAVYEEFSKIPMLASPDLKDEDIVDMLAYIDAVYKGTYKKKESGAAGAIPAGYEEGKKLFKDKACASCHNKDMKTKLVGPGLGGVEARWADYPKEDLYNWIRDSKAMVDAGHKKAVAVFEENNKIPMLAAPDLKDEEIKSILVYIEGVVAGVDVKKDSKDAVTPAGAMAEKAPRSYTWLYALLFIILGLLGAYLWNRGSQLEYDAAIARGEIPVGGEPKSFLGTLISSPVRGFMIFAAVVALTFFTADRAIGLGRQNGYQPDQPIKFSHKIHAGDNKINCEFCHDGARRSKHSNIPEGSTCIKCHAGITKGSLDGTAELTKIYVALGWNPSTGKYIPNYNNLSQDEVKGIYTKWIKSANSDADDIDKLVSMQWKGIESSMTNPMKPKLQGPVEWVRVHALPDHVYFNHSQHVKVGGMECQTCHGKVEEMDVLRQSSPLSMGWCVNCHRDTPVKFEDNPYYQEQFPWHKKRLEDGTIDKVTVGDLGGLECQKCHY